MSSASVAGGAAPRPEHSTAPEPQSAVAHAKAPESADVAQSVRAQMRTDHDAATVTVADCPGASAKPVVDGGGAPAFERMPGHTV